MTVVTVVELLAWVASAALGGWMVQDAVRVRRRHGEAYLVDGADPLDHPEAATPGTPS